MMPAQTTHQSGLQRRDEGGRWVGPIVNALLREMRLRRDLRAVQELDDHLLHDIGLARGGIETAVRHGRT